MKYLVRKSVVDVFGKIWMPMVEAAQRIEMRQGYDVDNARDDDGKLTRDSVERWLGTHAGDFSSIIDFSASIEDDKTGETVEIPWADEENEMKWHDCMYPAEE